MAVWSEPRLMREAHFVGARVDGDGCARIIVARLRGRAAATVVPLAVREGEVYTRGDDVFSLRASDRRSPLLVCYRIRRCGLFLLLTSRWFLVSPHPRH